MKVENKIIIFLIILVLLIGLFYLTSMPIKDTIDFCEEGGWDNSTYNFTTGILWEEEFSVKCNKDDADSDAFVGIIKAMYFWEDKE